MKTILFFLISFIALSAAISGVIMMADPFGEFMHLPLQLLDKTPFKNFRDPGILLAVFVGGSNLLAVLFNLQQTPNRYNWAMVGGIITCGWIIIQMFLIQTFMWLHFVYLGMGLLVVLTALQLKWKWIV
jgi:hypothetical protein